MVHPNANYHRYQDFEVTLVAVNKQSTLVHSSPCLLSHSLVLVGNSVVTRAIIVVYFRYSKTMASLAFQKFKAMEERSTMKGSDGYENDGESNSVARPPKRRSLIGSLASRFENDQQKEEKRRKQNLQKKVGILAYYYLFYNFSLTPITNDLQTNLDLL